MNIISSILDTEEYFMLQELMNYGPRLKNGRTSISGTIKWLIRTAYKGLLKKDDEKVEIKIIVECRRV